MVYNIYDDITRNEYYVRCTEHQLNSIGIREWEGRFRYTLYDDCNKKYTSVNGKKVVPFCHFCEIVLRLYANP